MVPVGPFTEYSRTFLSGELGRTIITCGYGGITVREYPSLNFRATAPLRYMPFHEEVALFFAKFYRLTKSDELKNHPVLSLSHRPFLMLDELLSRCTDRLIPQRTCAYTKVLLLSQDSLLT